MIIKQYLSYLKFNRFSKGIISPGVFIPVLEKKRLITELDEIIFSKVSELIERWVEMNKAIVPISVNLSRIDLYDKKMMEGIERVLKKSNSCNHVYRFELTESVYELLSENSISILKKLKQFGAKILIDDFGSGYSSFGMIADYDFDIIKLDMEFALRLDENQKVRRMVQSLIEMAHNLGVKVLLRVLKRRANSIF